MTNKEKEELLEGWRAFYKKYQERELNEMPKYINHDYLDFKPMDDKSMQLLEQKWIQLKTYSAKTKAFEKDIFVFTTKMKNTAIIGMTRYDKLSNSWYLEVASYVKLEKTNYGYYKVRTVHTKEDLRGSKYTLTLYYTLVKNGVLLCSDNEQYQGAKPLWKALARLVPVEIYNEENGETFNYNEDIPDHKVWSTDNSKYFDILRVKDLS